MGDVGEQVLQICLGLNTDHLARADQAGEACPVTTALIQAREERIPAVQSWTADDIFHEVGINVDAAIVEEEP